MRQKHVIYGLGLILMLGACHPATQTASKESRETQIMLNKADAALGMGNEQEAEALYREVAEQPGAGVRAHLQLASLMKQRGDKGGAKALLQEAHARNSNNVEVLRELAHIYLNEGRGDMADPLIAQGLERSPNDPRLLNLRGVRLDQQGEHQQAQAIYQRVLSEAYLPADKDYATNNLALSYIASGQPQKAVTLLEGYLDQADSPEPMRQTLALAYGVAGQPDNARTLLADQLDADAITENLRFYELYRQGNIERTSLFQVSATN